MEKYIKAVALIFFLFGLVGSMSGLIVFLSYKTSLFSDSWIQNLVHENDYKEFRAVLSMILYFPMLIASVGIYRKKRWGRSMGFVWSALNLPFFPFGTVLGLFSIWVLIKKKTKEIFYAAEKLKM